LAGAYRSRTYRRHRRAPTNGFEVRGTHRDPSAPEREGAITKAEFCLIFHWLSRLYRLRTDTSRLLIFFTPLSDDAMPSKALANIFWAN